jgi:hypothetical protein
LRLDPATTVKLPSGAITTMRVVFAEHDQRMLRFEHSHSPIVHLSLNRQPIAPIEAGGQARPILKKFVLPGGAAAAATASPVANPVVSPLANPPATPAGNPLVFSPYANNGFADDYNYFCTQQKASVCLYVPANVQLVLNGNSIYDYDYLVSQSVCTAEGGVYSTDCLYTYPALSKATYYPGEPSSATITSDCPSQEGFTTTFDPRGALEDQYGPSGLGPNDTFENANLASCVYQIYAPPTP